MAYVQHFIRPGIAAGSSLLRDPSRVSAVVSAMAAAVEGSGTLVSVKMRSGFDDASLFEDNLIAAQEVRLLHSNCCVGVMTVWQAVWVARG